MTKQQLIRETEIFKPLKGAIHIQILRHFKTVEQLKKAFGKDGAKWKPLMKS